MEDHFGYLPVKRMFEFEGGTVEPHAAFDAATAWMSKYAFGDGYLYPPLQARSVAVADGFLEVPVNEAGRPCLLHRLPVTHTIHLPGYEKTQEDGRYEIAGFVMHFLAFLFGYRCHFFDWWLDGRVPTRSTADHITSWHRQNNRALRDAVSAWSKWEKRQQTVAINVLYLHSRAPQYEWPWERLQAEYQTFDAVYAIALAQAVVVNVSHKKRFAAMCDALNLAFDKDKVDAIVDLRNDLIHEVIWDGRMPGEARSDASWRAAPWIHDLTKRAFLALCGVTGEYTSSPWWGLVSQPFLLDENSVEMPPT